MRKTSQDGGESTSATSGVENEIKKPKTGLLEFKSKKIGKRTAPNLSEESDDAVVEPLLQKNTNSTTQSAKYLAKAKADTVKEISKLFNDKKTQYTPTSGFSATETLLSEKDQVTSKPNPTNNAPLHNYMNTNIFHSHDTSIANGSTKSQLLVEIDGSKQSGCNPSPLIFTTAKIHTDGKSKHMEPVQMTPAPILSTTEVSIGKAGGTINEKKVSNGNSVITVFPKSPPIIEKTKENTVNILNSNLIPVTKSKDNITSKPANPCKSYTTIANSSTELISHTPEKIKQNTVNISILNITPTPKNSFITGKTKSITTLSNNPVEICPPPEPSKQIIPVNANDKPVKVNDKMLVDEPRIVMSETKLKSTISDITKTDISKKATKSPLKSTKALESPTDQSQTSQLDKNEKIKSDKNDDIFELDPSKNKDIKDPSNKNDKPPTVIKEFPNTSNTFDTNSTKPLQQQQKNISQISKTVIKTDSSKNAERSKGSSAKTSVSTKIPTQSKINDSKLSKELDKSPKSSANEISKINSKKSLNTDNLPSNKMPISTSIVKPAPSVSVSNVGSTSEKILNSSKAITTSVATTALPSSSIKAQVTSTKITTSAVNTKPTSAVTSIKSATKPSSVSSVKSQQMTATQTTSAVKQTNTSTAKTTSNKSPSITSTTTLKGNSSPSVSTAKSTSNKVAQVSTSKSTGNSPSAALPSTAAAEITNSTKTKVPNLDNKGGAKSSDDKKDIKVSKA